MNRAEWIVHLRTAFEDADAAARDMLRRPRRRSLGPSQHRKLYRDAAKQIRALLDDAPQEAPEAVAPAPPPPVPPEHEALLRAALSTTFDKRQHLPPLERARQKLLYFFHYALPNGARGRLATEIDSIVPDILAAVVEAVRAPLPAAPAATPTAG